MASNSHHVFHTGCAQIIPVISVVTVNSTPSSAEQYAMRSHFKSPLMRYIRLASPRRIADVYDRMACGTWK